jgi:hypothetical protein
MEIVRDVFKRKESIEPSICALRKCRLAHNDSSFLRNTSPGLPTFVADLCHE